MTERVTVSGVDEVIKTFKAFVSDMDKELAQAVQEAGELVEREAKQNAPKRSGTLANSIKSEVNVEGNTVTASIGSDLDYAPHVEYGTRDTVAQPFLEPALDVNTNEIVERLQEAVARSIKDNT